MAENFRVTVTSRLYGPFRTASSIRCDQPVSETTWQTDGPGDYRTPPVKLDRPGWYVYVQTVPGDDNHLGATTPCTEPRERVKVEAQPRVRTVVSNQRAAPGDEIFDRVIVEGLAGETATVQAALYGPFATREAMVCTGNPVWSGTVEAPGDGEYVTAPCPAHRARLLHLPRDDRRERARPRPPRRAAARRRRRRSSRARRRCARR